MHKAPKCPKGYRRCSVSKTCLHKVAKRTTKRCSKGSRQCANKKCYKYGKSVKTRRRFNRKYVH